jgi:hypothetical protein
MNCTELDALRTAYARGTLALEDQAAFEAHLSDCEECSHRIALAEPEVRGTASLPRSAVPVTDLWPGVRERIEARRRSGRVLVPAWMLAAAAVILVVLSSGGTALLLRPSPAIPVQPSVRVALLEAEYTEAAQELAMALNRVRDSLSPETVATIERNLAVIDQALAESRRALARDPGNTALEQVVVAAWRQKVDLLRRATVAGGAG